MLAPSAHPRSTTRSMPHTHTPAPEDCQRSSPRSPSHLAASDPPTRARSSRRTRSAHAASRPSPPQEPQPHKEPQACRVSRPSETTAFPAFPALPALPRPRTRVKSEVPPSMYLSHLSQRPSPGTPPTRSARINSLPSLSSSLPFRSGARKWTESELPPHPAPRDIPSGATWSPLRRRVFSGSSMSHNVETLYKQQSHVVYHSMRRRTGSTPQSPTTTYISSTLRATSPVSFLDSKAYPSASDWKPEDSRSGWESFMDDMMPRTRSERNSVLHSYSPRSGVASDRSSPAHSSCPARPVEHMQEKQYISHALARWTSGYPVQLVHIANNMLFRCPLLPVIRPVLHVICAVGLGAFMAVSLAGILLLSYLATFVDDSTDFSRLAFGGGQKVISTLSSGSHRLLMHWASPFMSTKNRKSASRSNVLSDASSDREQSDQSVPSSRPSPATRSSSAKGKARSDSESWHPYVALPHYLAEKLDVSTTPNESQKTRHDKSGEASPSFSSSSSSRRPRRTVNEYNVEGGDPLPSSGPPRMFASGWAIIIGGMLLAALFSLASQTIHWFGKARSVVVQPSECAPASHSDSEER